MVGKSILNTIYYLELFVTDNVGDPVTGLTTTFVIYKASDNSIITSGSLTDKGNGTYQSSYTFTVLGQFYIIYTTPSEYTNEIETVLVMEDYAKDDDLLRNLGLSDENKKISDTVHNSTGNITYAIVRLFPSATDFDNDTNVMATYEYNATYDANGLMLTMGIKRLS